MKIAVCGLWHLGLVIAACESDQHDVCAYDMDAATIGGLQQGKLPIFEPGLDELVARNVSAGRLRFSDDLRETVTDAAVVWITYDTPVDERDNSDVGFVAAAVDEAIPFMSDGALLLLSSQIPVGFCAAVEQRARELRAGAAISVAYSPENLQLGTALAAFRETDRVVAGTRSGGEDPRLHELFDRFTREIVWMKTESAEMTKHALNSFLATSLSFINEIAAVCEAVGADSADIERALRLDKRIGKYGYVRAGIGFAGGTLARDVQALTGVGSREGIPLPLLSAVWPSNAIAKEWTQRRIQSLIAPPARVAVLGLTYKPGTNTLRRSASVELATWLHEQGYAVSAFDPAVTSLDAEHAGLIELATSRGAAIADSAAIVIGTEWPEFSHLSAAELASSAKERPIVLDPKRVLSAEVRQDPRLRYYAVGYSQPLPASAQR